MLITSFRISEQLTSSAFDDNNLMGRSYACSLWSKGGPRSVLVSHAVFVSAHNNAHQGSRARPEHGGSAVCRHDAMQASRSQKQYSGRLEMKANRTITVPCVGKLSVMLDWRSITWSSRRSVHGPNANPKLSRVSLRTIEAIYSS